jgi:hypothetical protein
MLLASNQPPSRLERPGSGRRSQAVWEPLQSAASPHLQCKYQFVLRGHFGLNPLTAINRGVRSHTCLCVGLGGGSSGVTPRPTRSSGRRRRGPLSPLMRGLCHAGGRGPVDRSAGVASSTDSAKMSEVSASIIGTSDFQASILPHRTIDIAHLPLGGGPRRRFHPPARVG